MGIQRDTLRTIGYLLDRPDWVNLANGEIVFSSISEITDIGPKQCYDLEVPIDHNFVANDIVAHNTAALCKMAYAIANYNKDVCVIYHTIDDSLEQIVPRFVAIAEGSRSLSTNMIRRPEFWDGLGVHDVQEKREAGYSKVFELAKEGKLVVKDVTHGGSLAFAECLIQYYKNKYPGRRVVYFLDNFHKLTDFAGAKDERVRFKQLSQSIKSMAEHQQVAVITSVEYTKLAPGIKPTNYNISETAQITYDANFIAHLYSEVSELPGTYSICHRDKNWKGESQDLPRVELIIGKNKITEVKHSIFFDFWPSSSDYRYVSQEVVANEARERSGEIESGVSKSVKLFDNPEVTRENYNNRKKPGYQYAPV